MFLQVNGHVKDPATALFQTADGANHQIGVIQWEMRIATGELQATALLPAKDQLVREAHRSQARLDLMEPIFPLSQNPQEEVHLGRR